MAADCSTLLKRPPSAIPALTGIVGLVTFIIASAGLFTDPLHLGTRINGWAVLGITALVMIIIEIIIRRHTKAETEDFQYQSLNWTTLKRSLNPNLFVKIYGLSIIYTIIIFLYCNTPFFSKDSFQTLFHDLLPFWPAFITFGLRYVWITHTVLYTEQHDSLWHFGRFFLPYGQQTTDKNKVIQQALIWTIKGFFLPLMLRFYFDWWDGLTTREIPFSTSDLYTFKSVFEFLHDFIFYIDAGFAVIGYSLAAKLLNSHIRSAETNPSGWIVTILCYPPLNYGSLNQFVFYNDGYFWGDMLWNNPTLYVIWGSTILLFLIIYVFATIAMGFRFSNLTYRGITTWGPYAITKHPAYLSKCLSWWMIDIPFIAISPWIAIKNSIMLGLVCVLYALRAQYEEQMLARVDPLYREYQRYIRTTGGLWPRIKRFYHQHIIPIFQMFDHPN